jgi:hypothetical protein
MCDFFSAVATKDKLHAFYWVDSHEDIIELAGLSNQDRDPVDVHFVRLELRPDNPMTLNFEKWAFGVDQDRVPDWFVPEEWHQKMIEYLRTVPSLVEGEVKTLAEECWFCAIPVERMIGRSAIRFLLAGGTVNEVWAGGTVN